MKKFLMFVFTFISYYPLEAHVVQNIDEINRDFYDSSGSFFNAIPFSPLLPKLLGKYCKGDTILEVGSGPGGLAVWLRDQGHHVTCLEPSKKLSEAALEKGLEVYPLTIQEFETDLEYDCVVAISSLIHVPKKELPDQIKKIAKLLKPQGIFFVSFIEGDSEDLEDPTNVGKLRYFARWRESDLETLLSPYFDVLETHKVVNEKMGRTFFLSVYKLKT